jgi:hypothetical protein
VPVFGGHDGPVLIGIEGYPPVAQKVFGFVNRLLGGMQQAKPRQQRGVMVFRVEEPESPTQVFYSDGLDMAEACEKG